MNRILQYTVNSSESSIPIYEFLKRNGYSRHVITQIKKIENGIQKNGSWVYVTDLLTSGDQVTILLSEDDSQNAIIPKKMNLDIVYEDEDILIINKAADTPIHPSMHNYENSLANGVAWYSNQKDEHYVFRCINRLDRDTTGLTIIAKNMLSSCILSDMARNRQIERIYLAVVTGNLANSGTINAPIARKENSVVERQVDFSKGESAVTHYTPIKSKNGYTLVRVSLETGRTHQIRVHFNYIGHPLPGDYLYNPDYAIINRQALHSFQLQFMHPITKKLMKFEAPLPDDINILFS